MKVCINYGCEWYTKDHDNNCEMFRDVEGCTKDNKTIEVVKDKSSSSSPCEIISQPTCCWKTDEYYEESNTFETQCGEVFSFIDDGIKENNFKYCPFCGKEIKTGL